MFSAKQKVYKACLELVQERVNSIKLSISEAEESLREDSKSSMGDKYETSREIITQEIHKRQEVLANFIQLEKELTDIDPSAKNSTVQKGSLIITQRASFFIGGSLGKVLIDGKPIMVISSNAPIFGTLKELEKKSSTVFNGVEYKLIGME